MSQTPKSKPEPRLLDTETRNYFLDDQPTLGHDGSLTDNEKEEHERRSAMDAATPPFETAPTQDFADAAKAMIADSELDEFRPELADLDLTEAQKIELLRTLWSIMYGFAELGFRVDICAYLAALAEDEQSAPTRDATLFPHLTTKEPPNGAEDESPYA